TRPDAVGSDQLSFYQVLVEKNYPAPVESLALFDLRGGTELRVPGRSPRELLTVQERVGRVSDGIGSASFEPTPGRQCGRCEFRPLCPEFREVPAEERARLEGLVDRFVGLREDEHRLEMELRRTAEELHQSAERLGILRVPGTRAVARRHREARRSYPTEVIRPILEAEHLLDRASIPDPALV
ncbi:exonuclease-like protein, partial [mine drainage metagenome]